MCGKQIIGISISRQRKTIENKPQQIKQDINSDGQTPTLESERESEIYRRLEGESDALIDWDTLEVKENPLKNSGMGRRNQDISECKQKLNGVYI